jgi:hypothetical protein
MKARKELLNVTRFRIVLTSTDMIDENACLGLVPPRFIKVAPHLTLRKDSHIWTAQEYVLGKHLVFTSNQSHLLQLQPEGICTLLSVWVVEIAFRRPGLASLKLLESTISTSLWSLATMNDLELGRQPALPIMSLVNGWKCKLVKAKSIGWCLRAA